MAPNELSPLGLHCLPFGFQHFTETPISNNEHIQNEGWKSPIHKYKGKRVNNHTSIYIQVYRKKNPIYMFSMTMAKCLLCKKSRAKETAAYFGLKPIYCELDQI